jgi:ABC-2 type transport system ATP-binding protein
MTPSSSAAIDTEGLTRRFGETQALDGLTLTVPPGVVYGVLGPNGAGKTTAIRILATLLRPDGGRACVFGHDVVREADAVRRAICLTGQFASLDADLSCAENLRILGRLQGLGRLRAARRAGELLVAFGLEDAARRTVGSLSGGMRRRLDIAASLIIRPRLLFLDEPTTGLDPHSRRQTWDTVRGIVAEGTTVVLTTQYLDEADQLADRIAVIDHGTVVAEGTSHQLKAMVGASQLRVTLASASQRPQARQLLAAELGDPVVDDDDAATLSVRLGRRDGSEADIGALATLGLVRLAAEGIAVEAIALGQPTLDEVFLALTETSASGPAGVEAVRAPR